MAHPSFPSSPNATGDLGHFSPPREFNLLRHRPHKWLVYFFNAVRATALFRIWHILLFLGGWSTMVVLVSEKTSADLGEQFLFRERELMCQAYLRH